MCFCPSSSILFSGECRDSLPLSLPLSLFLRASGGTPERGAPLEAQLSVCNEPWGKITEWNVIIHAGLGEEHVASGWPGPAIASCSPPQNNKPALPAPLAPLWSSSLVAVSFRRPLAAIQSHLTLEGRLWSLACLSISLGNKTNCLLGPTVFLEFLRSVPLSPLVFICLGLFCQHFWPIIELVRWSWTINFSGQLLSLHNVPPLLSIVLIAFLCLALFIPRAQRCCPLFIQGKLKQHNSLPAILCFIFYFCSLTRIFGDSLSCWRKKLSGAFVIHFPRPHFSSCSGDLN